MQAGCVTLGQGGCPGTTLDDPPEPGQGNCPGWPDSVQGGAIVALAGSGGSWEVPHPGQNPCPGLSRRSPSEVVLVKRCEVSSIYGPAHGGGTPMRRTTIDRPPRGRWHLLPVGHHGPPMAASEVDESAADAGHTEGTLGTASRRLGVIERKEGCGANGTSSRWTWALPEGCVRDSERHRLCRVSGERVSLPPLILCSLCSLCILCALWILCTLWVLCRKTASHAIKDGKESKESPHDPASTLSLLRTDGTAAEGRSERSERGEG